MSDKTRDRLPDGIDGAMELKDLRSAERRSEAAAAWPALRAVDRLLARRDAPRPGRYDLGGGPAREMSVEVTSVAPDGDGSDRHGDDEPVRGAKQRKRVPVGPLG